MRKKVVEFNLSQRNKKLPEFRSGDVVKVYRKIKEGEKERAQVFEGMIISVKGKQSSSPMITVRKVSFGVGVELILPVYSPQIEKIELIKRANVKKSKLYYIREKFVKSLRLKYKEVADFIGKEKEEPVEKVEKTEEEAVASEEQTESQKEDKTKGKNPEENAVSNEEKKKMVKDQKEQEAKESKTEIKQKSGVKTEEKPEK